jgi:hypothetical protein
MTSASRDTDHTASASRTSPLQKVNRELRSSVRNHCRFVSTPDRLRLSKIVTGSSRDNSRATRFDPMNPAPPVTKCFATTAPFQQFILNLDARFYNGLRIPCKKSRQVRGVPLPYASHDFDGKSRQPDIFLAKMCRQPGARLVPRIAVTVSYNALRSSFLR